MSTRSTWPSRSIRQRLAVWLPVIVAGVILFSQLFVPPIVGIADNADYINVNKPLQLAPAPPYEAKRYFQYIVPKWVYDTRVPVEFRLVTSELALIAPFAYLTRAVAGGEFDLRWAGLIHAALFLLAVAVAAPVLARRWWLGLLAVSALCDVAYFSFFNSMYMDAASFVFLMLAAACYLRIGDGKRFAAGFGVALVFFITSKLQHAYLVFLLVPFLFVDPRLRRHCRLGGRVAMAVAMVAGFVGMKSHVPEDYHAFAGYNVIFYNLLPNSQTPREVLEELGLPPGMSVLSGTTAFVREAGIVDPRFRGTLMERGLHGALARYYLRHPEVAWRMVEDALRESALERQFGYGNLPKEAGAEPAARSNAFAMFSGVRLAAFAGRPLWYGLFLLVTAAAAIVGGWRCGGVWAAPCVLLAGMAGLEFSMSALADCLESTRHLFLFRAMMDLLFWSGAALGVSLWTEKFHGE